MHMAEENTTLNFQEFIEEIKAGVQEFFPEAEILITPTEKNNGLTLTGITIKEQGCRVIPTIYLNGPYESYKEGVFIPELVAEVADLYRKNKLEPEPEIPNIMDFEAVKDLICLRLVNRERNQERLNKMPHRDYLDLAAVYYIPIDIMLGTDYGASITMTDSHAAGWDVDADALFTLALANTERLFPASIKSMADIFREEHPEISLPGGTSMYVLMNRRSGGGAAALLNAGILRQFGEEHGDFYIFPSSVHELILQPVRQLGMALGKEEASAMVRDINKSQVAPDEVLSNSAYYYHADTGEIEIFS